MTQHEQVIVQVELVNALRRLGASFGEIQVAVLDFNAALVRLSSGRVVTREQIEDIEPDAPPLRRIRL